MRVYVLTVSQANILTLKIKDVLFQNVHFNGKCWIWKPSIRAYKQMGASCLISGMGFLRDRDQLKVCYAMWFCSVYKAVNKKRFVFWLFLSLETVGKIVFSVKLYVSTHEGKDRGSGAAFSWIRAAHEQDGVRKVA